MISGYILFFVVGIGIGVHLEIEQVNKQNSYSNAISGTIAVVNQDSGVVNEQEAVNYSEAFISSLDDSYKTVSYREAQEGLEKGSFSAVVVFPSDLSANVYSLNDSTLQSPMVQFTVNKYLPESEYIATYMKLLDLENDINKTISYLYVTSLYDEFHAAQDQIKKVLQNDEKDLSALKDLQLHDFRLDVDWSTLPNVEFTPNEIDFNEFISDVQEYAGNISQKYIDSYSVAQKDYEEYKDSISDYMFRIEPYAGEWCEAVRFWQSNVYQYSFDLENNSSLYRDEVKKFEENTGTCYESLFDLSQILTGNLKDVIQQYEKYENSLILYKRNLEDYVQNYYKNNKEFAAVSGDAETPSEPEFDLSSVNFEIVDTDFDSTETFDQAEQEMFQIDFLLNEKDSNGITLQERINSYFDALKVYFSSDFSTDVSDSKSTADQPDKSISVENLPKYEGIDLDNYYLPSDVGNEETPIPLKEDFITNYNLLTEELKKYNPTDYVNEKIKDQVNSIVGLYESDLSVVDARLSNNMNSNNNLFTQKYTELNSYISALKSDADKAYSTQEEDLINALSGFYNIKVNTSDENRNLLEDFSNMIPKSRKNSVTNKELVNFTISPVEFAESNIRVSEETDFITFDKLMRMCNIVMLTTMILFLVSVMIVIILHIKEKKQH